MGHKSPEDWVLQIQGQLSSLCPPQQCFVELSGWSASCIHVSDQCLAYSQPLPTSYTPPLPHAFIRSCWSMFCLQPLSPSQHVRRKKRTPLPYPSTALFLNLKKITKQYGSITKILRKKWTITYNPTSLI